MVYVIGQISKCQKLAVMHNMSIVKKSNCWTTDETHNFNCHSLTPVGGACMEMCPSIINLQAESNYMTSPIQPSIYLIAGDLK